jgi:hypothetical protein
MERMFVELKKCLRGWLRCLRIKKFGIFKQTFPKTYFYIRYSNDEIVHFFFFKQWLGFTYHYREYTLKKEEELTNYCR